MEAGTETPKKIKPVTDDDIQGFMDAREGYNLVKGSIDALKDALDEKEAELVARLLQGAKVRSDTFSIAVEVSERRNAFSWKEVAMGLFRELGRDPEEEEKKVLESVVPTKYQKLDIRLVDAEKIVRSVKKAQKALGRK